MTLGMTRPGIPLNAQSVFNEAQIRVIKLTDQLKQNHKTLLTDYPLRDYISQLDRSPSGKGYYCFSNDIEGFCRNIIVREGKQGLAVYHRLVLATLMIRSLEKMMPEAMDDDIRRLLIQNFHRILKYMDTQPPEFYQPTDDKFSKDLSTCMLRLMPMGSQKIVLNGIPRKILLQSGGLEAAYILAEMGGFKPLYEMHTDSHDMDLLREFTAEGWDRCYMRIATMLESHKDVKGVFGISWFFDPRLEHISPKLNFLRERPLNNGGRIFFVADDKDGSSGALARSATRQKLFEEKKYVPAHYLMVWPGKRLIDWAKKFKENQSQHMSQQQELA